VYGSLSRVVSSITTESADQPFPASGKTAITRNTSATSSARRFGVIVVNPELRMFLRDDCRDLVHGLERGLLAPIIRRDLAMFEAGLEMRNIAAKNHRSSLREPHEQRLVAGRVSGCGEQHEASVAKDIVVAVDELCRVLLTTVRLNVEENQLVNVFGEFGICLGGLKSA